MNAKIEQIFLDTETTSLDETRGQIWEIGMVVRGTFGLDDELLFQIRPDMGRAEPEALKIGRFEERFKVPDGYDAAAIHPETGEVYMRLDMNELLWEVQSPLQGRQIVAAIPSFDEAFLKSLLRPYGRRCGWHYRSRCIESITAGKVGYDPGGLKNCMAALNLPFDEAAQHTALGDARACRDIWDAIFASTESTVV